jgi:hypothetical protein
MMKGAMQQSHSQNYDRQPAQSATQLHENKMKTVRFAGLALEIGCRLH